jgi:NAD(P)-dependent dehydrogenase (short-subunit alcohol dehydrogenase family)
MREQGSGHILQFSSVGGRIGPPGRAAYSAAKWGVEGFSEVLAKEVGPLGIKVTIIEPGGFRTDFAGSSTKISDGRPEYDSTVGRVARFQRNYNGTQPGDPSKRRPSSFTSRASTNRRCGCCSAATPPRPWNRTILRASKPTGNGGP